MSTTTTALSTGTWTIDPAHTEIGFSVRHLMSKVRGNFKQFEGSVTTGENLTDTAVRVSVDLSSIDTGNTDRDNHLRSGDFFEVETNPTMTFESTDVLEKGEDRVVLVGDLTIKGVTRRIELDTELFDEGADPWGGTRFGAEATAEISRKDFGIDFNIPVQGDRVMIGDKVTIVITAQAVLQA
ncbi:YceI family protein [Aeromicrobium terrae]|uniref:YceI family protein n=1 Tax=Aeromicrobium terrae TaxID=2498846 RepID=A0A5C8NNA3_9ACTN|nr:YceI family protein [Aeromicrobium terrae]TXL61933.1 YceI family protein [Aeromicrobium terrae]